MRVEWDNTKRLANIRKHGIDFVACEAFFEGQTVTLEDKRFDYGEQRFVKLRRAGRPHRRRGPHRGRRAYPRHLDTKSNET